jgi:hypothetical protein
MTYFRIHSKCQGGLTFDENSAETMKNFLTLFLSENAVLQGDLHHPVNPPSPYFLGILVLF